MIDLAETIAGALTLTVALAWNEAAKAGIAKLVPLNHDSTFYATLLYAGAVTVLVILMIYLVDFFAMTASANFAGAFAGASRLMGARGRSNPGHRSHRPAYAAH